MPETFWHLFASISVVMLILHLFVLVKKICIRVGANLESKLKKFMQKQHLLMVLFGTNLVSNISIKASKRVSYLMPDKHFFDANKVKV